MRLIRNHGGCEDRVDDVCAYTLRAWRCKVQRCRGAKVQRRKGAKTSGASPVALAGNTIGGCSVFTGKTRATPYR